MAAGSFGAGSAFLHFQSSVRVATTPYDLIPRDENLGASLGLISD